ncbi:hypothetical protein P0C22_16080, partial [Plesiomonas shigelloides]|uniref:hypothetical protein n=1 Tax=Plesiomonas shigelloides TaxID=703 RepID=UPI0030C64452
SEKPILTDGLFAFLGFVFSFSFPVFVLICFLFFVFLPFPTCFSVPAILLDCADSFSIPQSSFILLISLTQIAHLRKFPRKTSHLELQPQLNRQIKNPPKRVLIKDVSVLR